jgi:hypothetical protein
LNPALADRSPARLLREGDVDDEPGAGRAQAVRLRRLTNRPCGFPHQTGSGDLAWADEFSEFLGTIPDDAAGRVVWRIGYIPEPVGVDGTAVGDRFHRPLGRPDGYGAPCTSATPLATA